MEDPREKQGKILMNERKFEDAIGIFSSLLQSNVEKYGEMADECAKAYFLYGDALLTKEEEVPTDDLLGNVDKGASSSNEDGDGSSSNAATIAVLPPPPDLEVDNYDNDEEGVDEEDDADDLQIAFENLETARIILSKDEESRRKPEALLLADVHMRLGDLNRINNNIGLAVVEYRSALNLRVKHCEAWDSAISHAYFCLAVAHVYNAAEVEEQLKETEKRCALVNYQLSKECIGLWLKQHDGLGSSHSVSESEIKDKKELVDELQETIDALDAELFELSKIAPKEGVTTTIGFGAAGASSSSSSSLSSSASGTAIGVSNSASSTVPVNVFSGVSIKSRQTGGNSISVNVSESRTMNTLLVKRKKREDEK